MSHHVYTVRGVVLGLRPARESDRLALILTSDLGLVHGTARGVREMRSKLRSALLELALVKVSLVRGQRQWRITTVTLLRDSATELRGKTQALSALHRVTALVARLVRGEEKHPELYEHLESDIVSLIDHPPADISEWETQTVAQLLADLGYLDKSNLGLEQKDLVLAINQGLKESGLSS